MNLSIEFMVSLLRKSLMLVLIFLSACSSSPDPYMTIPDISSYGSDPPNDTLRVFCAEGQFDLTWQLMEEFQKSHRGITAEIFLYEQNIPIGKLPIGKHDLIMVSDVQFSDMPEEYWRIKYARDGVVAIIHSSNPFCNEILEMGLRKQQNAPILAGEKSVEGTGDTGLEPYALDKIFICSDEFMPGKLSADFAGLDPDQYVCVITAGFQAMVDSIRTEPRSIGLCYQRYAYDPSTRKEIAEIKVIPIDCNSNGILEDQENFYGNLDLLRRAMWLGKYPCHTYLDYYIVAKEEPTNTLHIEFMKWVLTEGKNKLSSEGYVLLRTRIINEEITALNGLLAST